MYLTVDPVVYDIDILYTNGEGVDCEVSMTVGESSFPVSPDTMTSDLQEMLEAILPEVGGVRVEKEVGLTEDNNTRVSLRLIFLTNQIEYLLPIDVSSDPNNCSNTAVAVTPPDATPTFQLGFPDSTRRTNPLPVAVTTAAELQTELETLLSYECTRNAPPNVSWYIIPYHNTYKALVQPFCSVSVIIVHKVLA